MSIFKSLFAKRAVLPEAKSGNSVSILADIDPNSFLAFALGGSGSVTAAQAFRFYQNCAAVATAVDMIADEIEQITPVIQGPDGNIITNGPILDLLKKPNPAQDYREFIGSLSRSWLLAHDSYIASEGSMTRTPLNMWAVKPVNVSVTESMSDGFASGFFVATGPATNDYQRREIKRQWRYLANQFSEITRISGFSSRATDAHPDSPLEAAATDIRQQIIGKGHNLKLMQNGGRLSLVAMFKDTLSPEQHVERRDRLRGDIGGSDNAGKIAVISSEDVELKEFGSSNKDMDYENLDKISAMAIYMRYKIPLPLLSNDASTYNNMEQSKYDLYDRCVLPAFSVIAEGLSNLLLPRAGIDPTKFKITYNPEQISALKARLLSEISLRKTIGVETINELRALLPNREPLGPAMDDLYQPGTMVPVKEETYAVEDLASSTERAQARMQSGPDA